MSAIRIAAAGAALLALAACSGGGAAPLSAGSLIAKVPGCSVSRVPSGGVALQATGERECDASGGTVDVATFTSASLARSWLLSLSPGVCDTIMGGGWAAMIYPTVQDACGLVSRLAGELGGRMVSP